MVAIQQVKQTTANNQQVKLANEDQVHGHTIEQINQSRKTLEDRIKLDKQVIDENEKERERKQAIYLEKRDNSNFLKKQIFEQKKHNLLDNHQTLSLNRSNNDIEKYQ